MKLSDLKLIIKEEISDFFNSDAPKAKYSKGDKLNYRGMNYTVVSDSGYVVDEKGKESTYNHNQLNQGIFRKPVNEEGKMEEYRFTVYYWENNSYDKNYYITDPIKAASEKEAFEIAQAEAEQFAKDEYVKIKNIKKLEK